RAYFSCRTRKRIGDPDGARPKKNRGPPVRRRRNRAWPEHRAGERSASRRARARRPAFSRRARPGLQARPAADLPLLLRPRPPRRRLELLFRARALRQGRLRDPSAAAGLSTPELSAEHALLDPAIGVLTLPLLKPCSASMPACSACSAR